MVFHGADRKVQSINQSLNSAMWIVSPLQEVVHTYTVGMSPIRFLVIHSCSINMPLLKMIIPFLSWLTEKFKL